MNNKTINVRSTVKPTTSFTYEEAQSVLDNTDNATAEACVNAAETLNTFVKELKIDIAKLKNAASLKASVYGLTYDEDHIELSFDGTEILMQDSNGDKWWVKITPVSTDVDIYRLNEMIRDAIFASCPWIQNASKQLGLFEIRFEHNRVIEDAHANNGTLPQEMVEFFTTRQISLFTEEVSEKKIRKYDGTQVRLFNLI